jgi:hypothetical protein
MYLSIIFFVKKFIRLCVNSKFLCTFAANKKNHNNFNIIIKKMKKLMSLACIALAVVVVVNGCDKTKSNPYSGTYVGTLSSVSEKYNKDNVSMVFTNGIKDETNLYLYGLPLTKITGEKYDAKGELVIKIIQLVTPNVKSEEIKNASVAFTFATGKVNMSATYEVLGAIDVSVINYDGVKQ